MRPRQLLSPLFGLLLIISIGGADMPTLISRLNSYAGLAALTMDFVLENNVLFGAFGQVQASAVAEIPYDEVVEMDDINSDFAGTDDELYTADDTRMVFGDAKAVIGDIVKALSDGSGIHGSRTDPAWDSDVTAWSRSSLTPSRGRD